VIFLFPTGELRQGHCELEFDASAFPCASTGSYWVDTVIAPTGFELALSATSGHWWCRIDRPLAAPRGLHPSTNEINRRRGLHSRAMVEIEQMCSLECSLYGPERRINTARIAVGGR
jgi:hypothetical protein